MIDALSPSPNSGLSMTAKPTMLSYADASTVWLLSWTGSDNNAIAARLGTNAQRVADILAENTYVGSRDNALRIRNARAAIQNARSS